MAVLDANNLTVCMHEISTLTVRRALGTSLVGRRTGAILALAGARARAPFHPTVSRATRAQLFHVPCERQSGPTRERVGVVVGEVREGERRKRPRLRGRVKEAKSGGECEVEVGVGVGVGVGVEVEVGVGVGVEVEVEGRGERARGIFPDRQVMDRGWR